ncbi:ABC transporter permease [Leucobacter luti]|uniref:Putative spermidine/putrescine transport system permease protein n=1 Tax=Leucobacter luti TaxID=340320 RepID=A0A4Q7TGR3_9MICO|nr:ABC transporter permease [Leucobacter luti]MBL3699687.1 ABC transporter permease [Leucobacter luti]RZT59463.1 putative spermidine/putrescine transport system permease protein [Leucobacter luti]
MKLKIGLSVFAVIVVIWLVAPTLVIIPISFTDQASFNFPPKGWSTRWYENFFTDTGWLKAFWASARVAVLTAIVATIAGVCAALALVKMRPRWASWLQQYFMLPLLVPGIVIAIGLYAIFLSTGLLGTLLGFVLAHTVVSLPLVLTNVLASLRGVDTRLGDAAATLGANRWDTFRLVTLPLIAPGVLSGALLAFVTSFDEVILSLFIQTPYLQTLPVKIFRSVTKDTDPTVAAVSVMVMLVSVTVMLIAQFSGRRSRGPVLPR